MKINILLKIGIIVIIANLFSCRKDFSTVSSNGNLSFSNDTLFLDTVFNNLSTNTYLLTVYNNSKNDIHIPKIKLAKDDSKYRINIDGVASTEFDDVTLLKNDSLFIFVEVTPTENQNEIETIYKDSILFDPEGTLQYVNLVTLVKDVTFLFDNEQTDFELTDTHFTNEKPYVIYGNAIVPENKNFIVDAGTLIYFSENSSLTISEGATVNITGTQSDSIIFRSDVLNYNYDQVPGQWNGININQAASVNIEYLKILNPTIGLNISNTTNLVSIKNTEIYNASQHAIYTINTNIEGENIVTGQTGLTSLYLQGGDYSFKHCTFANYWSKGIIHENTVTLANYYTDDESVEILTPLNTANFANCIIAGTRSNSLSLNKSDDNNIFNFHFNTCLLDIDNEEENELYDTENIDYYNNVLLNQKLDFRDTQINDLRIGTLNGGINLADINTASEVPFDIIGRNRTQNPDIGAYQYIDFITLNNEDE